MKLPFISLSLNQVRLCLAYKEESLRQIKTGAKELYLLRVSVGRNYNTHRNFEMPPTSYDEKYFSHQIDYIFKTV